MRDPEPPPTIDDVIEDVSDPRELPGRSEERRFALRFRSLLAPDALRMMLDRDPFLALDLTAGGVEVGMPAASAAIPSLLAAMALFRIAINEPLSNDADSVCERARILRLSESESLDSREIEPRSTSCRSSWYRDAAGAEACLAKHDPPWNKGGFELPSDASFRSHFSTRRNSFLRDDRCIDGGTVSSEEAVA